MMRIAYPDAGSRLSPGDTPSAGEFGARHVPHRRRPRRRRCPRSPRSPILARIADEVDLDDGVRVAGELVRSALHDRALPGRRSPRALLPRRAPDSRRRNSGADGGAASSAAGWPTPCSPAPPPRGCRFAYRTAAGVPSFVVASRRPRRRAPRAASSTSRRAPPPRCSPAWSARSTATASASAPSWPATPPPACARTAPSSRCARDDAPTVARVALRLQQRTPFALAPSVPAFARQIAPGVALADEPGTADRTFGRHRCRLVAAGLVAAGTRRRCRRPTRRRPGAAHRRRDSTPPPCT